MLPSLLFVLLLLLSEMLSASSCFESTVPRATFFSIAGQLPFKMRQAVSHKKESWHGVDTLLIRHKA